MPSTTAPGTLEIDDPAILDEIAVALKPYPTLPGTSGDTIRYSVKLVDRALHESNLVYTDAVVVP